jgi:hypothetical protein
MTAMDVAAKAALFALWLLAVWLPPYLIWRWMRSRRPSTVPRPIVADGANSSVPVLATFTGIRGLAWVGIATNNLNPKLVIEPDGISFKVLRLQTRRYGEIERVDLRIFGATVNLCFAFRGEALTFDANVGKLALAADVLKLLAGRVDLSDRARELVGSATRRTPAEPLELAAGQSDPLQLIKEAERRFRFQPRWKEELVVSAAEGSFTLALAMGIPTAYLPASADWSREAPEWARSLWPILRDELEDWCRNNGTQLIIGEPAGLSPT